ncbi:MULTISPECIES: ATP-binding protein [unclassified Luteococcus]|uniref:ATP-binding protein n=1 Tax=unclassified Luteococcus TaxID=2639923 RepID=UPI00313F38B8
MTQLSPAQARLLLDGYLDDICRADIPRLGEVRQHPATLRQLLRALARLTGSELRYATLAADLAPVAPTIQPETISTLVALLERLFVVELVPPQVTALRSRARLRTSPKVHLADPALAAAALDADEEALVGDLNTCGILFESAVVHDLTVLTEALGGAVHHYRDSNGHEIDAVLTFPGGRWAAVEVKLGGPQALSGAESLRKAVRQIDATRPPSFMAVVTGTGFTADLGEGVITFPLSALGA